MGKIFRRPDLICEACSFLVELSSTQTYDFYILRGNDDPITKKCIKETYFWKFNCLGWKKILKERTLTNDFIVEFLSSIDPILLIVNQHLSENVILQMFHKYTMNFPILGRTIPIFTNNYLTERYFQNILWPYLLTYQQMSSDLINYISYERIKFEDEKLQRYFGLLLVIISLYHYKHCATLNT